MARFACSVDKCRMCLQERPLCEYFSHGYNFRKPNRVNYIWIYPGWKSTPLERNSDQENAVAFYRGNSDPSSVYFFFSRSGQVWLIGYVSPTFFWLHLPGGGLFGGIFVFVSLRALLEMWHPGNPHGC